MDRRQEKGTEPCEREGGIPGLRPHRATTGTAERSTGGREKELRHRLRRADLPAVAEVRRLLRDHLYGWGVSGLADTAELLTSEVVTNALVHTDRGAELTATLTDAPARRLRVEVYDFVTHHPKMRKAAADESSGRGLLLVQALADAWGVRPHGVGKIVWFELGAAGTR